MVWFYCVLAHGTREAQTVDGVTSFYECGCASSDESDDGGEASKRAGGRVGMAWSDVGVRARMGAGSRRADGAEAGHRGAATASRGATEGASFVGEHTGDGARRPRTNDSRPGCQEFYGYGQWRQAKNSALRFGGRSAFGGG